MLTLFHPFLAVLSEADLGSSLSEALSAEIEFVLSDDGSLVAAASARSSALSSTLAVRVDEVFVAHVGCRLEKSILKHKERNMKGKEGYT